MSGGPIYVRIKDSKGAWRTLEIPEQIWEAAEAVTRWMDKEGIVEFRELRRRLD